ncbi:MAG: hypothetical protein WBV81_03745, partial [Ignavibacteriaceae bacterium]
AFSIAMPGIPFIYYGNEIGMRQLYNMPYVEGAYKPRAGARSPMQWSLGKNDGFSTSASGKLYLPVDTSSDAPNVKSEEKDPNSLLNKVRKLIQLKKKEPALEAYAEFVPVYAKENTYPFIFARANGKDVILAVFNPAASEKTADFSLNIKAGRFTLLAGEDSQIEINGNRYKLKIKGQTYSLYKLIHN